MQKAVYFNIDKPNKVTISLKGVPRISSTLTVIFVPIIQQASIMEHNMMENEVMELHEQTFAKEFHQRDSASLLQMQMSLENAYNSFHLQQEARIENIVQSEQREVRGTAGQTTSGTSEIFGCQEPY